MGWGWGVCHVKSGPGDGVQKMEVRGTVGATINFVELRRYISVMNVCVVVLLRLAETSIPALVPTYPPVQWVPRTL